MMQPVTKSSIEVMCPSNIPEAVSNAFMLAQKPRSGAAFISLPQDVLLEETDEKPIDTVNTFIYGLAQKKQIEAGAELINKANFPILLVGLEMSRPANSAALNHLLSKCEIPVVGTIQSAGSVSASQFKNYVSRVGLFKNSPGDKALEQADLVIACGFDPVEYDPEIWNKNRNKKILNINYEQNDIHLTFQPVIELSGDIASNLNQLAEIVELRPGIEDQSNITSLRQELIDEVKQAENKSTEMLHPLCFIHVLNEVVNKDTTILCDIGTHYMWMARYFFSFHAHHILFSNGQQTLGVALPWAMAASMINPDKKIISMSGDGGFLFSAMELETAVREKCNFVHCIWRDGSYDMVKEQQLMKYKRESHVNFGCIDVPCFAQSFGAQGFVLENPSEFKSLLEKALSLQGPVLIDIPIDYSDNHKLFELTDTNVGN